MPDMEVGVIQSLFTTDPFGRVKAKQLRKKIDRMRIRVREEGGEWHAGLDRQRPNVILCLVRLAAGSKNVTNRHQGGAHPRGSDTSQGVF